jgi:hypothetical protein
MADKSLILLQQENLELKKENQGLQETVTKLIEELNRLQGIERRPIVTTNADKIVRSIEEEIIEEQIKRLDMVSRGQTLSLEEVRALDLLIKNKKLIDINKVIEPDYTKIPEGQTELDLLQLAGNDEPEADTKSKPRTKTSQKNTLA